MKMKGGVGTRDPNSPTDIEGRFIAKSRAAAGRGVVALSIHCCKSVSYPTCICLWCKKDLE